MKKILLALAMCCFIAGCSENQAETKSVAGQVGPAGPQGPQGPAGNPGKDGKDGKNGTNGKDGLNGKDGAPGKDGAAGKNGTNGTNGKDGKDGKNGTLIKIFTADKATCPNGGLLVVTYTDTNNNGTYEDCDTILQKMPLCAPACSCKHDYDDPKHNGHCSHGDDDKHDDDEKCEYYYGHKCK